MTEIVSLCIRFLIGSLLLVTAALKVLSPAESAALAVAYDIPPILTAGVVQAELALAAFLIFGLWPKQMLFMSAAMFAFFGAFSIYRGWVGYESCGCFGSLKVSPWITAALDGAMLVFAVWAAWLAPNEHRLESKRLFLAGGSYTLAGLLAAVSMIANAPASSIDAGRLVILEPEAWVGKPFPLAAHLTPEVSIEQGPWTLLLYHHDCPHCQEAVPAYERLAIAGSHQIVLIEAPPYGFDQSPEGPAIRVRLSDDREWFVQTPVEVRIDEGIVVGVSFDLPSVSEQPSQLSQRVRSSPSFVN